MARIGIIFGLLLCGLTITGMSATTQKSYTQFVPMMFGIPMLFLGVVSLNPHRRAGSVFVALVLSVLAVTLGGGRLLVLAMDWANGEYVNPISLRLVITMTTLSLVFVLIAWWWQYRRTRQPGSGGQVPKSKPLSSTSTATFRKPAVSNDNPYQTPAILNEPSPLRSSGAAATNPPVKPAPQIKTGDSSPTDLSRSESK
jgi:hypothetical protein